ncbi:Ankyrin repeat protein [Pandoravirus kuranda]|uniref:Ankyrin repeat protein n=2 Tax=Pandoravirus TaxID=2060084 RepID=A0AA95J276_9VIRU|nr:Ankyrin repeat domain containing protein [Pandoravirus neocaledonia]AVK76066.1 Ankyrin repeat domain containing protein [Pandoravirus neocaledonia]WBR14594.1 Ankyrin repeat protein [Pandoravirus kuranda]
MDDFEREMEALTEVGGRSSALKEAIERGNVRIVERLTEDGFGLKDKYFSACSKAILAGQFEVLKLLVSRGAELDRYAVNQAASTGRLDLLEWLVVDNRKWVDEYAYEAAARGGHTAVLDWLLERGIKWAADSVMDAVKCGQLGALQWFHDHGCTFNSEHAHAAADKGNLAVLQWLHAKGCPIDVASCVANARINEHDDIVAWLRRDEDPTVIEIERREIETLASGRKRAREALDRHDAAIAEHKEHIKRIKRESADDRAHAEMVAVVEPILNGKCLRGSWWKDRMSDPTCRTWFFIKEKDDAIISALLSVCDGDDTRLDLETRSLLRRRVKIVDREAALAIKVTSECYANSDYEDDARFHSDDDWKIILSNGDERDDCNIIIDSSSAFDKWLNKNGEVDDREYNGDSDGHRYTGTVTLEGLLIEVSSIV